MRRLSALMFAVTVSGCFDLELPVPADQRPGSVRATVLVPRVGTAELFPAQGATLELVGSGLSATADGDGNVLLQGVRSDVGVLRLSATGDQNEPLVRVFDLALVGGGRGRSISLGTVALGRLATLTGMVRRQDRTAGVGHSGIQVFSPGTELSATTSDNGSFTLAGVPEGQLPLTVYSPGYSPLTLSVSVRAAELRNVGTMVLPVATATPAMATVTGTVVDSSAHPVSGASVSTSTGLQVAVEQGRFSLANVAAGLVSLTVSGPSFRSATLPNLFFTGQDRDLGTIVLASGEDPPPSADAGAPDAGYVVSGAVEAVSFAEGNLPTQDGGWVQVPPPTSTLPGDLVVLMFFRNYADTPATTNRADWHHLSSQDYTGFTTEIAYRRAAPDESTLTGVYQLDAPSSAEWALGVYRNVDLVELHDTGLANLSGDVANHEPFFLLPQQCAPDDLLVDVGFNDETTPCEGPSDADGGPAPFVSAFHSSGNVVLVEIPCTPTGQVPVYQGSCRYGHWMTQFELRLRAAP